MRWWILVFAIGAAALQTRPSLPALAWSALLPLCALPLLVGAGSPRWRRSRGALALLLAAALGFFYAAWRADLRLGEFLPKAWEGRELRLVGRVVGLPETTASGLRFVLDVAAVATPGASVPGRIQLAWYARPGELPPRLGGGDCIELAARLYRPHASVNPGGFDYSAWLLERGIRAGGSLIGRPAPASGCAGAPRALLDRSREAIRSQLRAALGDAPYAGVVVALAVGDQDAIPPAHWTLFRQTGTTHLFSVSGLHITLFSALVLALTRILWRRLSGLNLRLPARTAGIVLGMTAAAAYTALAGFGIPAQRTLLMLAAATVIALLDRLPSPSRLLAGALLVVVLVDPWAAFAPGFWLSFVAVAALLYANMGRLEPVPIWRGWLRAQWAVTLALTPLLLALFHEVSLVSPLANALAIPLISLLAVPLSLAAALLPWQGLAMLAHAVVAGVMSPLEWLVRLPQPLFHGAVPGWPAILLALLGAGLLLLPKGFPRRWLGWPLFLPLLFPVLPAPGAGEAWVTVFDVGQGEAVLVRTHGHSLLVDSGPRYASGEDAGARVVAPALWSQGIDRLDGLVVSHDDLDHSGGALSLIRSHHPGWLLTSLAGMPALGATGAAVLAARPDAAACVAGQAWNWDGVAFSVLHPPAHHYGQAGYSDNDRSCVIRVEAAQGRDSVLIAGDIERLSEMNLLERQALSPADVLVAPHHGSAGSSTPAFLRALAPSWVVIPVGQRNRYGHPSPAALARYRAVGAEIARTDRDGAVTIELGIRSRSGVELARARDDMRRYWWE